MITIPGSVLTMRALDSGPLTKEEGSEGVRERARDRKQKESERGKERKNEKIEGCYR